jgi:hypothetical protein
MTNKTDPWRSCASYFSTFSECSEKYPLRFRDLKGGNKKESSTPTKDSIQEDE